MRSKIKKMLRYRTNYLRRHHLIEIWCTRIVGTEWAFVGNKSPEMFEIIVSFFADRNSLNFGNVDELRCVPSTHQRLLVSRSGNSQCPPTFVIPRETILHCIRVLPAAKPHNGYVCLRRYRGLSIKIPHAVHSFVAAAGKSLRRTNSALVL